MNVFAKFNEILSMILQDIKETKRYGHRVGQSVGRTDFQTDNRKTVYPPKNTVCGGYKKSNHQHEAQVTFLITFGLKSRCFKVVFL